MSESGIEKGTDVSTDLTGIHGLSHAGQPLITFGLAYRKWEQLLFGQSRGLDRGGEGIQNSAI